MCPVCRVNRAVLCGAGEWLGSWKEGTKESEVPSLGCFLPGRCEGGSAVLRRNMA